MPKNIRNALWQKWNSHGHHNAPVAAPLILQLWCEKFECMLLQRELVSEDLNLIMFGTCLRICLLRFCSNKSYA